MNFSGNTPHSSSPEKSQSSGNIVNYSDHINRSVRSAFLYQSFQFSTIFYKLMSSKDLTQGIVAVDLPSLEFSPELGEFLQNFRKCPKKLYPFPEVDEALRRLRIAGSAGACGFLSGQSHSAFGHGLDMVRSGLQDFRQQKLNQINMSFEKQSGFIYYTQENCFRKFVRIIILVGLDTSSSDLYGDVLNVGTSV